MVVTNAMGVVFMATLLSASDAGVTFVFPEDGATNRLAWSKLSDASRDAVCETLQFAPVPPLVAATYGLTERELRKLAAFEASRRMTPEAGARRRQAIHAAFAKVCREKGVPDRERDLLLLRLNGVKR